MPAQKITDIVDVFHRDVYPRIDTRNGGALSKASEGKTLLITGGSKGIGRSIALLHAHTHPRSIIITARTMSSLDLVASEIAAIDPKIRVIKASVDVSDAAAVSAFFRDLREVEKVGRIDVLFNNAGALEPRLPFAQQNLSAWTTTINANIIGVANFTHEFLRHNFTAVGGSSDGTTESNNKQALKDVTVIVTSSIAAILSSPGSSAYQTSSKFFSPYNCSSDADYFFQISTQSVQLGGIPTDLAQNLPTFLLDHWRDNGHESPDLSGGFTAWLLTPEADFLRGRYASATWDVDALVAKRQAILDGDLLKVRVEMG
ncbi:hypothetical protein HWV62_14258 [Athelia sp. TMB]|nr:hypothetical protein HWV62_14258 [Athelia sp. TMB]